MQITRLRTFTRSVVVAAMIALSALGLAGVATASGPGTPSTSSSDAVVGATLYGNPSRAAQYWQQQSLDDCAEMAVADVVGEITGRAPAELEILARAQALPSSVGPGPIYVAGQGTNSRDLPYLLASYRINSFYTDVTTGTGPATGINALGQYLATGHKVIAGVNAATIWNAGGDRTSADHAVVVTGIDLAAGVVYLNDSGTPRGRGERVSIATFQTSWSTADYAMVVTA